MCRLASINQTINDGVAHFVKSHKCRYHVTFDLQHTLGVMCTLGVLKLKINVKAICYR